MIDRLVRRIHALKKNPRKRSDLEKLVNEPVTFQVGGRTGKKTIRTVTIQEPSDAEFNEHLRFFTDAFIKNMPLLHKLVKDPDSLTESDIPQTFPLFFGSHELVAHLVGEDVDFVHNEMTRRQTIKVLDTYLDMVGFDTIADFWGKCFMAALQSWNTASATGPTPPPWSVEQSSPSVAS